MGLREFAVVLGAIAAVIMLVTTVETLVVAPTQISHASQPLGPPLEFASPNVTYSSAGVSYLFLVTQAQDGALWNQTLLYTTSGLLGGAPADASLEVVGPAGEVVASFENVSWDGATTWATTSDSPVLVGQTIVLSVTLAMTGGGLGVTWAQPSKGGAYEFGGLP